MAAIGGRWHASVGKHDSAAYLDGNGAVRFVYADQPDGELFIVAKVWANGDGNFADTARLVATAPELLAALKRLVEYCNNHSDYDAISDADRVIHKAEGRDTQCAPTGE